MMRTLAFLSVAAAWSTDTESSVQHPDAHIDGFVISAVHLHGDDGSLHRRCLRSVWFSCVTRVNSSASESGRRDWAGS